MGMTEAPLGFSKIPAERRRNQPVPPVRELRRSNKAGWTELQPFKKRSIGDVVFPESDFKNFLAGRKRSPLVLDRPLGDLWPQVGFPPLLQEIESMPLRDFLALPADEAYGFVRERYPKLPGMLHDYFRNLAISPAVSLLNDILQRQQMPVLPQNEELAESMLEGAFNKMIEMPLTRETRFPIHKISRRPAPERIKEFRRRMVNVLKLHYGMEQGLPQTYEDIAASINRARKPGVIADWAERGLRRLRSDDIVSRLRIEMPA